MNKLKAQIPDDEFLELADFKKMFKCETSKARLLMSSIGTVTIGETPMVKRQKLYEHIEKYGGISITWPRRKQKRS